MYCICRWQTYAPNAHLTCFDETQQSNFYRTPTQTYVPAPRLPAEVTSAWVGAEDERKFGRELVEALLRAQLLSLPELDTYLLKVGRKWRQSGETA